MKINQGRWQCVGRRYLSFGVESLQSTAMSALVIVGLLQSLMIRQNPIELSFRSHKSMRISRTFFVSMLLQTLYKYVCSPSLQSGEKHPLRNSYFKSFSLTCNTQFCLAFVTIELHHQVGFIFEASFHCASTLIKASPLLNSGALSHFIDIAIAITFA